MRNALLAAAVSLAVLATPALAQSHPLVGAWEIEFAAGMRMENGEATPINAKATLTVTQTADSLVATVAVHPTPDRPARPPYRLATARPAGNSATFVQQSQATMNVDGDARPVTITLTWRLTAEGDALSGTLSREVPGGPGGGMPDSPVTGKRAGQAG